MNTVRALLDDLREVATRERTEGTTRRRPGDAARAVLAALLLVPLIVHAHHPTATEEAVVRLFESIPAGAKTLFLILYQLAALWAVGQLWCQIMVAPWSMSHRSPCQTSMFGLRQERSTLLISASNQTTRPASAGSTW